MTSTTPAEQTQRAAPGRRLFIASLLASLTLAAMHAANAREPAPMNTTSHDETPSITALTTQQQALVPIAAFAASGNVDRLKPALEAGLDAGLSISETREVLLQVYAYAGFPRSLNALAQLMDVAQARKARGLQDDPGQEPTHAAPQGDALLKAGRANQQRLAGGPVAGPLFDFAPQANVYLQTHLFGDLFERDNLDWQRREIATVSMLSALSGVESQLFAHVGMSMNIGVTADALKQLSDVLEAQVDQASAQRVRHALERKLRSGAHD